MLAFCRKVFFFEGWLLFFSGTWMLLFPASLLAMQGLTSEEDQSVTSLGNLRQFGSMCILMGYVGVFAPVLKEVVQACLIADFLWMWAFYTILVERSNWTTGGSIFSIVSVLFLASTRILYLLNLSPPEGAKKKST
jgi:hypothetical protein